MQPAATIIPGTLGSLNQAGIFDEFYWIPSASNFEGIDGVLGTADGNVYTLQATIASTHKSPKEGIQKVWDSFSAAVRTARTWHFVIVTNTNLAAEKYVERYLRMLNEFKLNNKNVTVEIWGCVLE